MVEAVKHIGFKFNVHQLQEAMEEVDRDENHTLDFFEYMLIIDNIYRRNGEWKGHDVRIIQSKVNASFHLLQCWHL